MFEVNDRVTWKHKKSWEFGTITEISGEPHYPIIFVQWDDLDTLRWYHGVELRKVRPDEENLKP